MTLSRAELEHAERQVAAGQPHHLAVPLDLSASSGGGGWLPADGSALVAVSVVAVVHQAGAARTAATIPFASAAAAVVRVPPKLFEVKVCHRSRGLLVRTALNGTAAAPWYPYGIYNSFGSMCLGQQTPASYPCPVGMRKASYVADMQEERRYGFNSPLPYYPDQSSGPKPAGGVFSTEFVATLDELGTLGMRVQISVRMFAINNHAELTNAINQLKGHPAVLSWYLADEPDGAMVVPAKLVAAYKLIKKLDPHHPVNIVLNCAGATPATQPGTGFAVSDYAKAADVMMSDPYCISVVRKAACIGCVGGAAFAHTKISSMVAADPFQPMWLVPQAFGGGGDHWGRPPSGKEFRLMALGALVAGATGTIVFGWQVRPARTDSH
jgi:hypothetical protein